MSFSTTKKIYAKAMALMAHSGFEIQNSIIVKQVPIYW